MDVLRTKTDEVDVSFEVSFPSHFEKEISDIEDCLSSLQKEADKLNSEVKRLTNEADWIDYTVSVASGVLTGLIDVFFVGELDLKECQDWGNDKVEKFVKKVAGEDGTDDNALKRAIEKLEKKTKSKFPSDSNMNDFGGSLQHHFRDFAHHPTLVGLVFSILTQFTGMCYGTDTVGKFLVVPVKDQDRIGKTIPEKLCYATVYWFLHLVSDMAGSDKTPGSGTGIPGPILSLAKELSVLPPFNKMKRGDMDLSKFLSKIFNGTLFASRDENGKIVKDSVVPVDLRTELGILHEQAFPVILNEIIVRVFYSIRRLVFELREKNISKLSDLKQLDWKEIIPFRNRTIVRMITIASGTFVAIDTAEATVHAMKTAAVTSAGGPVTAGAAAAASFLLHVNYVGVGRFTIAVITDVSMGRKRRILTGERVEVYTQMLSLTNAKLFYREADLLIDYRDLLKNEKEMWVEADKTTESMNRMCEELKKSYEWLLTSLEKIIDSMTSIGAYLDGVEENNPGLINHLVGRTTKNLKGGKKVNV